MENTNLSDKSKEALKSEVWEELRDGLKEEIVKEYLQTGYADGIKQLDIKVSGRDYKVLDRGENTTFYDALGNTLFSIGNEELSAEYEKLKKSGDAPNPADRQEDASNAVEEEKPVSSETDKEGAAEEAPPVEVPAAPEEMEDFKGKACEKLQGELKKANDKQFADPVIGYLLKRCEEDNGLAQDVMQEHKTWEKCFKYIFDQARKQAKGNSAAVRDDVVYEWAEDYYHKDDKAEEEKKAREEAERKKREAERKKKAADQKAADKKNPKKTAAKEDKVEEKQAEPPKPKKNSKDMDGQMDLFSMMGM